MQAVWYRDQILKAILAAEVALEDESDNDGVNSRVLVGDRPPPVVLRSGFRAREKVAGRVGTAIW